MAENMPDAALTLVESLGIAPASLEQLATDPAELPALMVHTDSAPSTVRRYKSGQAVMQYAWSVYYRAAPDGSGGRVDVASVLDGIRDAVTAAEMEMPAGCTFMRTVAPRTVSLADATDRYETYSVEFTTEYITR